MLIGHETVMWVRAAAYTLDLEGVCIPDPEGAPMQVQAGECIQALGEVYTPVPEADYMPAPHLNLTVITGHHEEYYSRSCMNEAYFININS